MATLGDQQTEVERRSGHPLHRLLRSPCPRVARRPGQLDAERLVGRRQAVDVVGVVAGPDADVGDVTKSVGRLAARPSVSATSCPCAQVSINRAVTIDAGLIGGPNHGSLVPAGTSARAAARRARPSRHHASSSTGGRAPALSPRRRPTPSHRPSPRWPIGTLPGPWRRGWRPRRSSRGGRSDRRSSSRRPASRSATTPRRGHGPWHRAPRSRRRGQRATQRGRPPVNTGTAGKKQSSAPDCFLPVRSPGM